MDQDCSTLSLRRSPERAIESKKVDRFDRGLGEQSIFIYKVKGISTHRPLIDSISLQT